MNKNGKVLTIILLVLLLLGVSGFGGYYLANVKTKDKTKPQDTCEKCPEVTCKDDETECMCPTCESNNYMHVFTYANNFKGYNLYSYLHNQGDDLQVIDYNGELLFIEERDSNNSSCIFRLFGGKAKFEKDGSGKEVYECENDYTENTSGTITKMNIKTSEVKTVKIINSCRSDGGPFIYVVMNDGTVNELIFIEGSNMREKVFKDYKVKDIVDFRCENQLEAGYEHSIFTLLLSDGTTKEIKN